VVLIDLENQHAALAFVPRPRDYVLGFVHEGGAHAVDVAAAVFDVQRIPVDRADAADVAAIWHLATLMLAGAPDRLRDGAPVFFVSNDHLFGTAARVLALDPRFHAHVVEAVPWALFPA